MLTSYIMRFDMPAGAAQQCQPTRLVSETQRGKRVTNQRPRLNFSHTNFQHAYLSFNSNLNLKSTVLMRVEDEHLV